MRSILVPKAANVATPGHPVLSRALVLGLFGAQMLGS